MKARNALICEFLGTLFLLAIVVGSGIMGDRLSNGNAAVALLVNASATAGGLYVLIAIFGPISGAHFNPAVTLALNISEARPRRIVAGYIVVQLVGAVLGVLLAHAMFAEPLWQPGTRVRTGAAQWLSEFVATYGLLLTIFLGVRYRRQEVPVLVAAYIFAAYMFTASTSFANPAVTIARSLTQTFAGIRPEDAAAFVGFQLLGAFAAAATVAVLASEHTVSTVQ
jgi:glycerol uptake facilitator-like aquaporin